MRDLVMTHERLQNQVCYKKKQLKAKVIKGLRERTEYLDSSLS